MYRGDKSIRGLGIVSGNAPPAFQELCAVPHGSGNTRQISGLCAGLAKELGRGSGTLQGGCPGWQYDRNSALREEVLAAYRAVCSKEGTIEATHGGLECRLFVEKLPGLDAVSFGPELHDVHSVKERLSVRPTRRAYEVTRELVRRLSAARG